MFAKNIKISCYDKQIAISIDRAFSVEKIVEFLHNSCLQKCSQFDSKPTSTPQYSDQ